VTDLFTAAQMKFHYQDFGAINEALKYAAGSMQQQGVDLGQGLTVLGMMANGRVLHQRKGRPYVPYSHKCQLKHRNIFNAMQKAIWTYLLHWKI
ncbi:hypothetical protein, partial [Piscirickettsia salmonis]